MTPDRNESPVTASSPAPATPPSETEGDIVTRLDNAIAAIDRGDHALWGGDAFLALLNVLTESRALLARAASLPDTAGEREAGRWSIQDRWPHGYTVYRTEDGCYLHRDGRAFSNPDYFDNKGDAKDAIDRFCSAPAQRPSEPEGSAE